MSTQFFGHIIDNEEVESISGERFDVWNPWTQEVFAQAAEGGAEDAERAIASARKAFDEGPWPRMTHPERAAAIHKLADLMEERADELATLDSTNMAKPFAQAKHDVGRSVANFRFFADHQRDHTGEVYPMPSGHHTYSEFGPAGVVAAISPWNFPLMMATWKIAPAIAWGNTCIIKPSEDTPASVTLLGRLAVEAGFPPGVLNVLNGHGAPAGSTLTADDRVDRVTFTGSSVTGKAVMASASTHLAPVSLELGGKGANIVFDDADMDNAVYWAVEAIFRNSGQICLAGSRLYVQSGIYDEFMERFVAAAEALTIGDPFDPEVAFSSLASKKHFDKVSGYLEDVEEQGGTVLTGGVDEGAAGWSGRRSSPTCPWTPASTARRSSARCASSTASRPRPRRSTWPMTPATGSTRCSSPRTSRGRTASPHTCGPARCGSTASSSATCAPLRWGR